MSPLGDQIRRILIDNWDPLSVRQFPSNVDEYDTTVYGIIDMLERRTASLENLRRYLDDQAYELVNTWDDDAALDRTASLLEKLNLPPE